MGERMVIPTIVTSLSFIGTIGTTSTEGLMPFTLAARAPRSLPPALFEDQWYVWAGLIVAAIVIRFVGRFQKKPKVALIGWVLVLLAGLHMFIANRVDTPRERLFAVQASLVQAANQQNVPLIIAHFHPGFQAPQLGIHKLDLAAGEIESRLKTYGIKESTINRAKLVQQEGDIARADVVITTRTEMFGPIRTGWVLHWEDVPESDWRIRTADLVSINDQPWQDQRVPR